MTRMTGTDCAVMCNLINTHTYTHTHNESQHLAEATEKARLQRRFFFVLQQALTFRTRHYLCRQGIALAGTQHFRSQGPVSVHAHCTEEVTESEGREGANGVGVGVGVEGRKGDGNGGWGGNGDVDGDEERDGAGTGTGVEARGRTQDGNGDGSGDRNESISRDGNGTGTGTGTGMMTGSGRAERGETAQEIAQQL